MSNAAPALQLLSMALALGALPFVSGCTLCVLVAALRRLTMLDLRPGRYAYISRESFRWASYNALILLVRFTFMNFMRVTPLLPAFHRAMGAEIGPGVQINTNVMADSCLLTIGSDSVIGGDVTLICHSAERGELVLAPTRIGSRVTVGLMAVVLPGVEIGDGATVAAHSVVPKGTRIPPGELWGGVPARRIRPAATSEEAGREGPEGRELR
ncbi:MAG: acyltransferase [Candidatus Wallbacteria bacterium]|nr:acyltransferase [Candidatus Wallbacteria bacterium]